MRPSKVPARRKALEPVDEILLRIGALTDASTRRHRLARDTPEYAAALETEERLADQIWSLGAALEAGGGPAPLSRPTGGRSGSGGRSR